MKYKGPTDNPDGPYVNFDPVTGAAGSVPDAQDIEGPSREITNLIETVFGAGLADPADFTQLLAAIQALIRKRLTAPLTVYVDPAGNVANDGLTAGTPLPTLADAWSLLQKYDLNGHTPTIQLADGTYPAGFRARGQLPGQFGFVNIVGNAASPGNVIISATSEDALGAHHGATLSVSGLKVETTTSGNGLSCVYDGLINFDNVVFGAVAGAQCYASIGGTIQCGGNYEITGGAQHHWNCPQKGVVFIQPGTEVTLTGGPAFSVAFGLADNLSLANVAGITFIGAATGKRYSISAGSVMHTSGGGATYLPGDVAGTTSTGGQYL